MFSLNDLLDQVECQGTSRVFVIDEDEEFVLHQVFKGDDLRQVPYEIGCKELCYIYAAGDEIYYEVK